MTDSKQKIIRVRIAVAVDPSGDWTAQGYGISHWAASADRAMDHIADNLDPGEARYWVYAELPVPEVREIEGQVEALEETDG